MAALIYNVLRHIGLTGLIGPHAPAHHEAKRRRLRTMMQELMYVAARLVGHGRQWMLRFGRHCPAFHKKRAVVFGVRVDRLVIHLCLQAPSFLLLWYQH